MVSNCCLKYSLQPREYLLVHIKREPSVLFASDWLGNALRKMEMDVQIQGKEGIVT